MTPPPQHPRAGRIDAPGIVLTLAVALPLCLPTGTFHLVRPAGLLLSLGCILFHPSLKPPRGASWLAAFLATAALSLLWTPRPGPGVEMLLDLVLATAVAIVATGLGTAGLEILAALLATFHGLHAWYQRLVLLPQLAAATAGATDPTLDSVHQRAAGGRAFSTLGLPGHLGALLVALIPILVAALARPGDRLRRWAAGIGLVCAAAGLFASEALGASLALVLVAVVAFVGRRSAVHGRRRLVLVGLTALVALALVASRAGELRVANTSNPVRARLAQWDHGLNVLGIAPLTGNGLGSYEVSWLVFSRPGDVPAKNAHMSYLEIAAEIGLPALAFFLAFVVRSLGSPASQALRLGALALLVHAAVDFDLQSPPLLTASLVLVVSAGAGWQAALSARTRRGLALAVALALALACLREAGRPAAVGPDQPAPPSQREQDLARALRFWPLDAAARGEHARVLDAIGQRDAALAEVLRARKTEPRTAWLAGLEGDIRVARQEALGAYFAYRDAERLFPSRPEYATRADAVAERIHASLRTEAAGEGK